MNEESYSGTFLKWAEPLFQLLGEAPRSAKEKAVQIAMTTWNAVTLEDAGVKAGAIKELQQGLSRLPPPGPEIFRAVVDELIQSRRTTFANERWTISKCELRGSGDKLRVYLEARSIPMRS
jgi:hypothetical protein